MLESARALMDDYAKEIFDLWFSGKAPAEVTLDNEKWANYMRAEKRVAEQIRNALSAHAELMRDEVNSSPGRLQNTFSWPFHGEVAGPSGGYRTGYELLHGSNRSVGDVGITGQYTAVRSGAPGSAYTVRYEGLAFVWNDIIDINKTYKMDIQLGRAAGNMALCLHAGPPKDYILHIKWRAEYTMEVHVGPEVKGQAPSWLKTFPNR